MEQIFWSLISSVELRALVIARLVKEMSLDWLQRISVNGA